MALSEKQEGGTQFIERGSKVVWKKGVVGGCQWVGDPQEGRPSSAASS